MTPASLRASTLAFLTCIAACAAQAAANKSAASAAPASASPGAAKADALDTDGLPSFLLPVPGGTVEMGLDAAAVPPTAERVREIVGACEQAVLLDDASLLRRRLSPYIYFSHGSMLVELAAQHGKRVALRALLDFATVRAKLCMLRPRSVAGSARRQRTPCAV